jgi:hypothetical protein
MYSLNSANDMLPSQEQVHDGRRLHALRERVGKIFRGANKHDIVDVVSPIALSDGSEVDKQSAFSSTGSGCDGICRKRKSTAPSLGVCLVDPSFRPRIGRL